MLLAAKKLGICWVVIDEKHAVQPGFNRRYYATLRMSGAYSCVPDGKGPVGFLRHTFNKSGGDAPTSNAIEP